MVLVGKEALMDTLEAVWAYNHSYSDGEGRMVFDTDRVPRSLTQYVEVRDGRAVIDGVEDADRVLTDIYLRIKQKWSGYVYLTVDEGDGAELKRAMSDYLDRYVGYSLDGRDRHVLEFVDGDGGKPMLLMRLTPDAAARFVGVWRGFDGEEWKELYR